ncbi:MAG: site-2 protease family protein, partial [Planctomycetota bacterium]
MLALSFDKVYITGGVLFILLYAIIFHEVGHALMAYWMGDPTAKNAGRISLNPIVHLDPFGSILVPIITYLVMKAPFGWAKPVPVNPFNYRHYVRGDI